MSAGFSALSKDDQREVRRFQRLQRLSLETAAAPRRRWPWLVLVAFLLGLVAGATLAAAAEPPAVSMIVRPQIMLQRGDIRLEVRVPRHPDNRLLAITWSSDTGTMGSTMRQLDGEDAAVLHTLALPSQPPANYLFVATLVNALGKPRGRAEARIHVPEADR